MIEIKQTTPIWTFKKQLENQVGKIDNFHRDWKNYFAHNYTRITISQLNQESNCTLCGHPIFKEVGLLERTGSKVVNYKGIDFSIPDKIEVGCDCYGYNIKPVQNIIEKLRGAFPNLKVELDEDKIDINKLIQALFNYGITNAVSMNYKILITVKYLTCNDYIQLSNCMQFTAWPRYYPTNKSKKNISDVVFPSYAKPLSKIRPGTWPNTCEKWGDIFDNENYIVVINRDMIDNLIAEFKRSKK